MIDTIDIMPSTEPSTSSFNDSCSSSSALPIHDFLENYRLDSDFNGSSFNTLKGIVKKQPDAIMRRNKEGDLPIHLACKEWISDPLSYVILYSKKELVAAKDKDGRYPLSLACSSRGNRNMIKAMSLMYPHAASVRDKNGDSPLHLLCKTANEDPPPTDCILALSHASPEMASLPDSNGDYLIMKACDWVISAAENALLENIIFSKWPNDMPELNRSLGNFCCLLTHTHKDLVPKAMTYLMNEIDTIFDNYKIRWLHISTALALQFMLLPQIKCSIKWCAKNRLQLMNDIFLSDNDLPNLSYNAYKLIFGSQWNDVKGISMAKDKHNNYPLHNALRRIRRNKQLDPRIIKHLISLNPEAVSSKDNEGYYPLHLCLKYGASIEVVQAVFQAYPAAIYSLNSDMSNSGFSLEVAGTYDATVDVVFYLMQQDITCIVGNFHAISRRRQLEIDCNHEDLKRKKLKTDNN